MAGRTAAKILTERDNAILRWVGENGVGTLSQICTLFWPDAKPQTALDRLHQLVKAHWLDVQMHDIRRHGAPEHFFTLTKTGAAHFDPAIRNGLMIGLPTRPELPQQLFLGDVRIALMRQLAVEDKQIVGWRNERQLRSAHRIAANQQAKHTKTAQGWRTLAPASAYSTAIADAQAVIADKDGRETTLDIEADLGYSGRMLHEKVASYASHAQPVLWATTAGHLKTVAPVVAGYSHITPVAIPAIMVEV